MILHDPEAKKPYGVDWSVWANEDETIEESTWEAPDGIELLEDPAPLIAGLFTVIWVTGGTLGQTYDFVNHIVSSDGREDDKTLRLTVVPH